MSNPPSSEFKPQGIDDVEDFPWVCDANEGEHQSPSSAGRFAHIYHLMDKAKKAMRECRWRQATDYYTEANDIKPGDPIILSNRCTANLLICQHVKNMPASASEYRPLRGLDPTTHADRAFKDAEKVMSLRSSSVTSYILKANALFMLEKYELARDVIHRGLKIDPESTPLLNLGRIAESTCSKRSHVQSLCMDDYHCTICLNLLYEPVTTPCGHSFCRSCLFQTMDRGNRCPLCRTILFLNPGTCASSFTLSNITQKSFPDKYAERKLENENLTNPGVNILPLFVGDPILPCQKLQFNISEPRYRLMVRRIMEGSRRMGMVVIDPLTGSVADFACEVEITNYELLSDGSFFLEVESRRRCRIVQKWVQDGYRVAEVEWVHDAPPDGSAGETELLEMTRKAAAFASQWIELVQDAPRGEYAAVGTRLAQLYEAKGLMPSMQDPERFSFWLTTLTNLPSLEILKLLRSRDTKERIRLGILYIKAEEQGCILQ